MENQFDKNVWLVSVILNSKPYLLQCSWKLLKPLTEIDTYWCNNRQRNGCLYLFFRKSVYVWTFIPYNL